MRQPEILKRLVAFLNDIGNNDQRTVVENLQNSVQYMEEKLRIYEEILNKETGRKKPQLDESQKRRLAQAGARLNAYILATVENTFSPDTIRDWYRKLVGNKYNSVADGQKTRGPKRISDKMIELVVHMATANSQWGSVRIASYMYYLGYEISHSTVRRILINHGIDPDPEQTSKGDWKKFIEIHQHIISSCDFCTAEILTPGGIMRYHILFVENITTRAVCLGGIAHDPDGPWMAQAARNLTDAWDGVLLGQKYLMHDRDTLFTEQFELILQSIGVKGKKLPPRSPELNGHIESFIKTFKVECLNHLVLTSEAQLRYVVYHFLEYYNRERPHSSLDGRMIKPWQQPPDGEIMEFSRLGGLLKSYRRVKPEHDETPKDDIASAG